MTVNEKIFLEACINNQYICLKNNTALLLRKLFEFSTVPKDGSAIRRFPTVDIIKIHFLLENLWISEPSLNLLKNSNLA